jgi:hypothetical protein
LRGQWSKFSKLGLEAFCDLGENPQKLKNLVETIKNQIKNSNVFYGCLSFLIFQSLQKNNNNRFIK